MVDSTRVIPNRPLIRCIGRGFAIPLALLLVPSAGVAQVVSGVPDTVTLAPDSSDLRGRARSAQAQYERRRLRYLPVTNVSFTDACDERVGRFCSWYDEGDWYPQPEPPEVEELRSALLTVLDSVQRHLPGDGWVLGQRVWYHSEAGRREEALRAGQACGAVEPWWCAALQGFALHGLQRYLEAETAFERSLLLMDTERAQDWRIPRREVDGDSRRILDQLEGAPSDSVSAVLDRLWMLSDPLYLVDGNDRKTEHYARWTVTTLKERARNPFHIRWGKDIEQLTVRFGWEIAWQRSIDRRSILDGSNVIGRKHPERRDYMPSGSALESPGQRDAPGPARGQAATPEPVRAGVCSAAASDGRPACGLPERGPHDRRGHTLPSGGHHRPCRAPSRRTLARGRRTGGHAGSRRSLSRLLGPGAAAIQPLPGGVPKAC